MAAGYHKLMAEKQRVQITKVRRAREDRQKLKAHGGPAKEEQRGCEESSVRVRAGRTPW